MASANLIYVLEGENIVPVTLTTLDFRSQSN